MFAQVRPRQIMHLWYKTIIVNKGLFSPRKKELMGDPGCWLILAASYFPVFSLQTRTWF